jgi:hypothetical protein
MVEELGPVWRQLYEYTALIAQLERLEAETETTSGERERQVLIELSRKKAQLAEEIVDAAAPTIQEVILKVTITSALLSDGDLQVGLTSQCLDDCERVLTVEGDEEQCLKTLEPELWNACAQVRKRITQAVEDPETLDAAWWMDLRDLVRTITRHEAKTQAGLKAKGQMFQELFRFASVMDGLSALQMSYLRDFGSLAYHRLHVRDAAKPKHSGA